MTNTYEVTKRSGEVVSVEAKNEFVAVAKAHMLITGEKATSKDVTWHGVHAECKGYSYNKPVMTWSGK
jgi:transcriptional regulator with GAF, ATPase, and Fis domain